MSRLGSIQPFPITNKHFCPCEQRGCGRCTVRVIRTLQPVICGVGLITTEIAALLWNSPRRTTPRHELYCAEWRDW